MQRQTVACEHIDDPPHPFELDEWIDAQAQALEAHVETFRSQRCQSASG